jgi:uncharacterized protein YndB with AHSA1/START domain
MTTATIEKTIDIDLPVRAVYNQWTLFEEFPRFMEGVERVDQLSPERLRWRARVGGQEREWEARIIEQVPDHRIAWTSEAGEPTSGAVVFHERGDGQTEVALHLEYKPEGFVEMAGDRLGVLQRQVEGDLRRFKSYIEDVGHEGGGWRGSIRPHGGEADDAQRTAGKARRAREERRSFFSDALQGAASGALASVPMSAWLIWMRARDPRRAAKLAPPREITGNALRAIGLEDDANDRQLWAATIAMHTGYAAAMGAVYGLLGRRARFLPAPLRGAAFGGAVWGASYFGWVPAVGLGKSARKQAHATRAAMVRTNVGWGAGTAVLFAGMRRIGQHRRSQSDC